MHPLSDAAAQAGKDTDVVLSLGNIGAQLDAAVKPETLSAIVDMAELDHLKHRCANATRGAGGGGLAAAWLSRAIATLTTRAMALDPVGAEAIGLSPAHVDTNTTRLFSSGVGAKSAERQAGGRGRR